MALADENAAIAAFDREPRFRFLRGLTQERLGRADEGRADIAAALEVDPKLADQFARLGLKAD